MENNQGRNWKYKRIINIFLNEKHPGINIQELNEPIYAWAKLFCEKIGLPQENTNRNLTSGSKIPMEKPIKNIYTSKKDNTEEKRWNMFGQESKK